MRNLLVASLIFVWSVSHAQGVPAPPPGDTGPSLEFTMKYIEDKLNDIRFTMELTDINSGNKVTQEYAITMAQANPKDCSLTWHRGASPLYTIYQVSLRDVIAATIETGTTSQTVHARENRVLDINMSGKKAHVALSQNNRDPVAGSVGFVDVSSAAIVLPDEDSASRMANAINHAVQLCGGGDHDPFKPSASGSIPGNPSESGLPAVSAFSVPENGSAPVAQPAPSARPANQAVPSNWCASSAQVSYDGDSLDAKEDINLWFSVFEEHTERFRGISVYYTVTYSCYKRGPYTKEERAVGHLDRGVDHYSDKELFVAYECPLPDHGYPHVERVQITRISCN